MFEAMIEFGEATAVYPFKQHTLVQFWKRIAWEIVA